MNETQKEIIIFIFVVSGMIWLPIVGCIELITLGRFQVVSKVLTAFENFIDRTEGSITCLKKKK